EDIRGAGADVFVILTGDASRPRRDARPRVVEELHGPLVEAYDRLVRIVRTRVQLEHVLHALDVLGVELGYAPAFFRQGLRSCSASSTRTVSRPTLPAIPRTITSFATSLTVHRPRPLGGGPQTIAITRSRCGGVSRCLPPGRGRSWSAGCRPS